MRFNSWSMRYMFYTSVTLERLFRQYGKLQLIFVKPKACCVISTLRAFLTDEPCQKIVVNSEERNYDRVQGTIQGAVSFIHKMAKFELASKLKNTHLNFSKKRLFNQAGSFSYNKMGVTLVDRTSQSGPASSTFEKKHSFSSSAKTALHLACPTINPLLVINPTSQGNTLCKKFSCNL